KSATEPTPWMPIVFAATNGADYQGPKAFRFARASIDQVRVCDQSQDRQGARHHRAAAIARPRRRGNRMNRPSFFSETFSTVSGKKRTWLKRRVRDLRS